MKIGIVCYPTYGGSGVVATELGKSLAVRGHQIHFITYSRPIRLGHFVQNVSFHEVRTQDYPLFEYPPYESALASTIVDVARYQGLDLIHVHYAIPHASAGYLAREILKGMGLSVPLITTLHGTDITLVGKDKSYEPVVAFSINQSDGVTAVSQSLKDTSLQTFSLTAEIEVIPNFIDMKRFSRQNKEHFRLAIASQNEKIIVHTSNFRKVKRISDVIHIFHEISKGIRAKLLMVGDGPERPGAEQLCRELGICDKVVFLGNTNPVEEIYSVTDLFLMPSETESFGLSALEALACGVPVISTNSGGLPEININGVTGVTADVGAVSEMAQGALRILQDDHVWKEFSHNALIQASKFDVDAVVPEYEKYYERILERSRPRIVS